MKKLGLKARIYTKVQIGRDLKQKEKNGTVLFEHTEQTVSRIVVELVDSSEISLSIYKQDYIASGRAHTRVLVAFNLP